MGTPTNMNKMKSWKNRVTVARKELCKAISATNGEAACKSSLFSNKKNKIELYVYTLCNKACTPYFKGKKKRSIRKTVNILSHRLPRFHRREYRTPRFHRRLILLQM